MAEENASVRIAKMHVYGLDRFLQDTGAKAIDEEAGYQLLSLVTDRENRWNPLEIRALKMTCPSTSATYINAVPPQLSTVRAATDWVFDTENYLDRVGAQA